ncbi:trehalose-phosphatase [Jiella sonneratiae]|uniref:Trehalose 6-phosphate phosphatase n=1 Tax=Jiella sonneratiae TaxID=2816856 RepID=A0ABS3J3W2_9HYPH|nr:trehalose-phosphatase [Jiella sonneratiae]MBO0904363.1 trehalose-phosphatase [Jiella sonneratiae]
MKRPPAIDPKTHALFLDFDGTLVELVDDPEKVGLEAPRIDRLTEIAASLDGALAIVSGRRIADLDRFLSPLAFAAAGVHGLERRRAPGGAVEFLMQPEALDPIRDALAPTLEENRRLSLEDKGTALVLHYRTAPDLAEVAKAVMRKAAGGRDDLVVMEGDNIVEVHPSGMDKGRALEEFMTAAPFAGRVPVYLGDDTTDEFALKTVAAMGGLAVKVGTKPSVADHRLADVADVHHWLDVCGV